MDQDHETLERLSEELPKILEKLEEALRQKNPESVRHHLQAWEITAGELEDIEGGDDLVEEPPLVAAAWKFLSKR